LTTIRISAKTQDLSERADFSKARNFGSAFIPARKNKQSKKKPSGPALRSGVLLGWIALVVVLAATVGVRSGR
jgi:hypothetical protein